MHTLDHVLPVWDATRIERRVISAPIATTYDAMLTSDLRDAAVESWLVRALFALRFVPEPWSIAQGVRKLPPGHWLKFGSSGLEIGRWYDLATKRAPTIADADAARQGLRERLDAAVKARLVSDVPVGVFLSSGIDSALVAAIAAEALGGPGLRAGLSALVAWNFGFTWATAAGLLFVWAMIALAFIDLDSFYLPDDITLPLLWAGLLVNMGGAFVDLQTAVIGAVAGYLSLWLVYWAFKFATGKEGMGYGDFKLLAAIGAWLGWKMLPVVIMLSSLVGAVIGIGLIALARHERSKPIPFGPYLVLGGLIALFRGEAIVKYYLQTL